MQVDGEEPVLNIKFRELPYLMETGESEMIGIDTIVQGSSTASMNVIPTQESSKQAQQTESEGKKPSSQVELTQEEEECKSFQLKAQLPFWDP